MDAFDDEIRRQLGGAARDIQRSARLAPDTVRRAVRRHRAGVAARAATGVVALGLIAIALPLERPATDDRSALSPVAAPNATRGVTTAVPATPSATPSARPPTAQPPRPGATPYASAAATRRPPNVAVQPTPERATPPARPACAGSVAPEAAKPDGITVRVEPSSTSTRQGGTLRLTVRVRNDGLVPVRYTTSGQEYDFWASDARGRVWQWSLNQAFPQPLLSKTLQPGEERTAFVDWRLTGCAAQGTPPPLAAGDYTVRALWISDAEAGTSWWSAPVAVAIR